MLVPASSGGGAKLKTQTATTITSAANKFIAFPSGRYPLYASVTIGGSAQPCLLFPINGIIYAKGYFDKDSGAYGTFSASTSYTIEYTYLEN